MKYVFIINSHTTFLTAIGTVNYLNITLDNIKFIAVRNYKNTVLDIPFSWLDGNRLYDLFTDNENRAWVDKIKQLDDFIDNEIKEDYSLFVSHLWHPFFQALYTNRKCKDVSYIQEGAYALDGWFINKMNVFKRLYWKLSAFLKFKTTRIFYGPWYRDGMLKYHSRLTSYAIDDAFFAKLPSQNHIVKWPVVKLNVDCDTSYPIFVFDGYVSNGLIEQDYYLRQIDKMIEEDGKTMNYIKFHPAQSDNEQRAIINCFVSRGYKYETLRNEIPFEFYLTCFSNMTIVGFSSSLLIFGHRLGHKVISHDDWLIDSPLYSKYLSTPGTFILSKKIKYDS